MPRRSKAHAHAHARVPARYAAIAADIRSQIALGALAAGARVPSTRQIMKTWNVALATAVKALNTLQHEGLIRSEPRVGNVVTGEPAARRAPEPPRALNGERIVRAAIALADAEGLDALSMRAVASKLDVPTMSLYSHVRDKQALRLRMIDLAMAELQLPSVPPRDWRSGLEQSARTQWRLFRLHPWLAQVITVTRPLALPGMISHAEWVLASLSGLGLSSAQMMDLHISVFSYVRGLAVNLESEAAAQAETGMDEQAWADAQTAGFAALAASGSYPTFAKVLRDLEAGYDLELDAILELGLSQLLDGMQGWIARTVGSGG